MFAPEQLNDYVNTLRKNDLVDAELDRIQQLLIEMARTRNYVRTKNLTQLFQALLTEKARQKSIHKMSNHNPRNTENSGARPADNT